MRECGAGDAAETLHHHVGRDLAPWQFAARGEHQRDRRVEMRPGNRPQDRDDHDEDGARRDGVAEQRDRQIPAGEALGHDAGADDGRDQNRGTQALGEEPPPERAARAHAAEAGSCPASFFLPIASSWRCNESASSEQIGRLTKMSMRFDSMRSASAKARRPCASLPVAAAGSGTPPCAVIDCPGLLWQVSAAALSQTVNTKSSLGASGLANSLQLFERSPLTSKLSLRKRSSA